MPSDISELCISLPRFLFLTLVCPLRGQRAPPPRARRLKHRRQRISRWEPPAGKSHVDVLADGEEGRVKTANKKVLETCRKGEEVTDLKLDRDSTYSAYSACPDGQVMHRDLSDQPTDVFSFSVRVHCLLSRAHVQFHHELLTPARGAPPVERPSLRQIISGSVPVRLL